MNVTTKRTETLICPHCKGTFKGPQGLAMHIRWNHQGSGMANKMRRLAGRNAKKARDAAATNRRMRARNGDLTTLMATPVKTIRKYARRVKPELPMTAGKGGPANYCPECGCNMRAVNLAMSYKG